MGRLTVLRAKMEMAIKDNDMKNLAHLHQMIVGARRDITWAYRKLTRNKSATAKLSDRVKWSVVQSYPDGTALFKSKHNGSRKVMPYKINSYQNNCASRNF